MGMLDVFKSDAYGLVSLTLALEKLPYKPSRLGEMGLYTEKGTKDLTVQIEEKNGKLSLVQTAARGSMPRVQSTEGRKLRSFPALFLPENDTIMADEVQGVRKFGSEDETAGVAQVVNDKLTRLKANMEATHEYHRVGGLLGVTYDADGSTSLYDWYSEYGITQSQVSFDFSSSTLNILDKCLSIEMIIEDALGGKSYNGIHAMCGNQFFKNLVAHADVKDAFKAYQVGSGFTEEEVYPIGGVNKKRKGFLFGGIVWENYRGYMTAGTPFFPTDEARFFPKGVSDLFLGSFSPAPFMETVNTIGKPMYVKQKPMDFDMGIELHCCSSPLFLCTQPAVIVKGLRTGNVTGLYTMPTALA